MLKGYPDCSLHLDAYSTAQDRRHRGHAGDQIRMAKRFGQSRQVRRDTFRIRVAGDEQDRSVARREHPSKRRRPAAGAGPCPWQGNIHATFQVSADYPLAGTLA